MDGLEKPSYEMSAKLCRKCLCIYVLVTMTGMVRELTGGTRIKYHANGADNPPIEIDFTPPYR